jgi:putative acetyltransferase
MQITVRLIKKEDNAALAKIIRQVMEEFVVNLPNTVYTDPTTDNLFELFQKERAVYNVAEVEGKVVGGGGIYPTERLPDGVCELVKMWLLPEARGLGLGKMLIEKCLLQANELGFHRVYLESMPELKKALQIYEKFGFKYLKAQMGNSGHTGCQKWMIKSLEP